jgi:hypothetical protein
MSMNLKGCVSVAGQPPIPCVVQDMSLWGVRLRLVGVERVPPKFTLTIDAVEKAIDCETVWRNADEIGALTDLMA